MAALAQPQEGVVYDLAFVLKVGSSLLVEPSVSHLLLEHGTPNA